MYRGARGFTLVEALISSLMLAAGAAVVCSLALRCLTNDGYGMYYEQGYRLLDECLDKVIAGGVRESARQEMTVGDFGRRYPQYKYTIEFRKVEQAGLYEVTAEVAWEIEGYRNSVKTATLMYGGKDE